MDVNSVESKFQLLPISQPSVSGSCIVGRSVIAGWWVCGSTVEGSAVCKGKSVEESWAFPYQPSLLRLSLCWIRDLFNLSFSPSSSLPLLSLSSSYFPLCPLITPAFLSFFPHHFLHPSLLLSPSLLLFSRFLACSPSLLSIFHLFFFFFTPLNHPSFPIRLYPHLTLPPTPHPPSPILHPGSVHCEPGHVAP